MSNFTNPSVESIISRYFVRYNRLSGAIPYAFSDVNSNVLNIYVDLYGLFRTIYSRSYRTNVTDYVAFTSSIVSLCAHYRTFFKSRGVHTKIFLISSFNTPSFVKAELPEYNITMDDKRSNKVISDMMDFNLGLLDILCPYLPDIFFLKTEFESAVLMYEIMNREGNIPSLILTTDLYPLQLCTMKDNVALLWPRWSRAENGMVEDISAICPPRGHFEHEKSFAYIIQRTNGKTTSDTIRGAVIPSNFMLLEAMNQFKDRDLKVLLNVKIASKLINETPGGLETKLYPQDIFNRLKAEEAAGYHLDTTIFDKIQERFRALDLSFQHNIFKQNIECVTFHYENLSDPDALNLINSKYFANNPLDLLRL